jgi:hypothetical protein
MVEDNLIKLYFLNMKRIKSFFSKKQTIILIIILILITTLTALAFLKPKIFLESISTESISFESTDINLESNYPKFTFSDNHLVKINNSEFSVSRDTPFQSTKNNFIDGENRIEYCGYINLFFIRLVSSKCNTVDFRVDRIAPEFEITKKGKDKVILENYTFQAEGEIGARVFAGEEFIGEFSESKQEFSFRPKSGIIATKIYAKDDLGNISNFVDVEFYSFNDEGYVLKEFEGLKFPVHGTLMTGESHFFYKSDYVNPCAGPCGAVPQHISLTSSSISSIDSSFSDMKVSDPLRTVSEFSEKELTTNTGITGKFAYAFYPASFDYSNVNEGNFIFSVNNKTYSIRYFTIRDTIEQAFIEEEFYKLINNIVY